MTKRNKQPYKQQDYKISQKKQVKTKSENQRSSPKNENDNI
jgi:hypothetical protein